MADIKFYQTDEIDQGLKLENGKLGLKLDTSGNVNLSTTDAGLKAEVSIPAAPVTVTDAQIADRVITFTKSDGSNQTIELPALPVDVSLADAELTDENTLKLTLSNGVVKTVALANLIPPAKTAQQLLSEILADTTMKQQLVEALRGDAIKNAKDQLLGYALPA